MRGRAATVVLMTSGGRRAASPGQSTPLHDTSHGLHLLPLQTAILSQHLHVQSAQTTVELMLHHVPHALRAMPPSDTRDPMAIKVSRGDSHGLVK